MKIHIRKSAINTCNPYVVRKCECNKQAIILRVKLTYMKHIPYERNWYKYNLAYTIKIA